ncbi:peroxiredoxin-like family protein [Acuticoccus kandeliae]|uniref:peroxiredoxin-like family protein n=1 Tax=Acuticoccus kandeliae TaxID=2073160 RepID=UPI000D3ED968|nr:peroxiredoxin-like family protein [Acuticoccus kandeliae]
MVDEGYRAELERARHFGGPLSARLAIVRAAMHRFLPGYDAAMDRFVARITEAGAGSTAPQMGDVLPDFVLPDSEGRLVSLQALRARGPVVVAINRGVWCPLCRTSLAALAEIEPAIGKAGASFVALSPQRAAHARAHRADAKAPFPMLTDLDLGYAMTIGLAVPIGEELAQHYDELAIDLAGMNGNGGAFLPIPATFVVDRNGVVLARHVEPDPRTRMEPEAILQALGRIGAGPAGVTSDDSGALSMAPRS